jgi:hypothetical protein
MKKIIIIMSSMLVCFLVLLFSISCKSHNYSGQLTVVNKSSSELVSVKVEVCNQQLAFNNIAPGKSLKKIFEVTADSHYEISVLSKSGKLRSTHLGYITNGMNFSDRIIINDNEISLDRDL